MGKTGSGLASQVGTDTDSEGIVEVDPTQRYLRVCYRLFVFSLLCSYISFFFSDEELFILYNDLQYSDVLGKGAYKKV
jgi:hypothetical protein